MDLFSEVRVDFKGAQELGTNLRKSASELAAIKNHVRQTQAVFFRLKSDIGEIVKGSERMKMNFRDASRFKFSGSIKTGRFEYDRPGPGGAKDKDAYGGFHAAATGAAATAFFYKAAALANPTAMSRFQDAIEDATAVIGHRLVPYLNDMTAAVRQFGDFLARNPTLSKGVGIGVAGAAALGLAGLGLAGAKTAIGGLAWGFEQTRGGFNKLAGRSAHVYDSFSSEGADFMKGDRGPSRGSGSSSVYMAPGGRGRARGGRGGRARGAAMAAGKTLLLTAAISEGVEETVEATRQNPDEPSAWEKDFPHWTQQKIALNDPTGINTRAINRVRGWFGKVPIIPGESRAQQEQRQAAADSNSPTSRGAAARPAQYQDTLQAIMSMRQQIGSGAGQDPAERTAVATEKMADAMTEGGAGGGGWFANIIEVMKYAQSQTGRGT